MSPSPDPLRDFSAEEIRLHGRTKRVWVKGDGPAVIVMSEIPGITPEVADFARKVVDAGFTVFLPHLFGTDGAPKTAASLATSLGEVCIRREFTLLRHNRSSTITGWLRALCREAHARCGGPGVGAIGMCLTGNFALALATDPVVLAPVLSQPSLPLRALPGAARQLHVSEGELARVQQRVREDGLTVLGLRFSCDALCPRARFDHLHEALGDGFVEQEVDSCPGNPHGHPPWAHSVVTNDLIAEDGQPSQAALDRVLDLFRERLHPPA